MPIPIILGAAGALILRKVAMSVATGAVVTAGENLLDGTVKQLVYEIKDTEGVTEQTAKDVVGDMLADLAINSTLIFTSLQAGVGVKAAEWLGLTSKGVIKKGTTTVTKKVLTGEAATIAKKYMGPWEKYKAMSFASKLLTTVGLGVTGTWLFTGIANAIEPLWYKTAQINLILKEIGINYQFPVAEGSLKPGPFSLESFRDYAKGVETAGITAIINPVKLRSEVYSREALADVINYVYGEEVFKGNALSANKLIPLLTPFLVGGKSKSVTISTSTSTTQQSTTQSTTKVFTGILSQGVVSAGLSFEARQDDLIESVTELKQAAANNLAPYLQALLGKIVYEVKVVSSIVTKDGFKQTGTTQRIQTGTYSNGTPKYKTVTNKFATLNVYAITEKNSRAKLTTIVLGPVDSARLTVSQNDLTALNLSLPKEVTTTNISEITAIQPTQSSETIPVQQPVQETLQKPKLGEMQYYKTVVNGNTVYTYLSWYGNDPFGYTRITKSEFIANANTLSAEIRNAVINETGMFATGWRDPSVAKFQAYAPTPSEQYYTESYFNALPTTEQNRLKQLYPNYSFEFDTAPAVNAQAGGSATPTATSKTTANATTLFEWYQAQGKNLPSIADRAKLYQDLGLGQSSYYTGTSEQNTKLLNALKSGTNVATSQSSEYKGYIDNGALGVS